MVSNKLLWFLIFIAVSTQALRAMEPAQQLINECLIGTILKKLEANPIARHTLHHSSTIRDAQLNSDGSMLVTCQGSNSKDDRSIAIVWDLITGKKRYLIPHDAQVSSAHFSPDNTRVIISLSVGMTLTLNIQTGQFLLQKTIPLNPCPQIKRLFRVDQELPQLTTPSGAVIAFRYNSALMWDEAWGGKALDELRKLSLIQTVVLKRAFEANQKGEYYILNMNNEDHVEELAALRRIPYEVRLFLKRNRLRISVQPQSFLENFLMNVLKVLHT